MFIAANERKQIARLFHFFLCGEHLAMDCAKRQAQFFPDTYSRRFFTRQAKHENFHARVFKAGIGLLAPRGIGKPQSTSTITSYGRLLDEALSRGDCMESLLGMQIILEGFADVTLERINAGFPARRAGFERIRQLVLGQEDAHHGFGLKRLQQLIDPQLGTPAYLQDRAQDYLALIEEMMEEVTPLFNYFDEDPQAYYDTLRGRLPTGLFREAA